MVTSSLGPLVEYNGWLRRSLPTITTEARDIRGRFSVGCLLALPSLSFDHDRSLASRSPPPPPTELAECPLVPLSLSLSLSLCGLPSYLLIALRVLRYPPDKQVFIPREGSSRAMARSFLVVDLAEDEALTGVFVFILVATVLAALPVEYNIIRFVRDLVSGSSRARSHPGGFAHLLQDFGSGVHLNFLC